MPRGANPFVVAYFDRGEKVGNCRYAYTCRSCSAHFPKGRGEHLLEHITRRCEGFTPEQRERILNTNQVAVAKPKLLRSLLIGAEGSSKQESSLLALNALVAASERLDNPPDALEDHECVGGAENDLNPENASSTSIESIVTEDHNASPLPEGAAPCHTDSWAPEPLATDFESDLHAMLTNALYQHNGPTSETASPSGGILTPVSCSDMSSANVSPQHFFETSPSPGIVSSFASQSIHGNGGVGPVRSSPAKTSVSPYAAKGSPPQRVETQNMRWRRACIRCRMLKKTCSLGDPCTTCQGLLGVSVWNIPCIRAPLSKVFELHSADPFKLLAAQELQKLSLTHSISDDRLKLAFHHAGDPATAMHLEVQKAFPLPTVFGSYSQKILQYILPAEARLTGLELNKLFSRSMSWIHEREPYQLVSCTLKAAERMQHNAKRKLVAQALHLWHVIHFLTSTDDLWDIRFADLATSQSTSRARFTQQALGEDRVSCLLAQLRASASEQASKGFVSLVDETEKLLNRRAATTYCFSNFLAIILLVSCMERMVAWTYRVPNWPLSVPPEQYRAQAEELADLIAAMTKIRGVAPRIKLENGIIKHQPASLDDTPDEEAMKWFDELNITKQFLDERESCTDHPIDFRDFEMRFSSRVLLRCLVT